MRAQIQDGKPKGYLPLARKLIGDTDNTCRWQALIVVGEFIASEPKAVWRIVARYGRSKDEDMRSGVACVLLEHLLPRDFEYVFRELSMLVRSGNREITDTVCMCWVFDLTKRQVRRLQSLIGASVSRPWPRASA